MYSPHYCTHSAAYRTICLLTCSETAITAWTVWYRSLNTRKHSFPKRKGGRGGREGEGEEGEGREGGEGGRGKSEGEREGREGGREKEGRDGRRKETNRLGA